MQTVDVDKNLAEKLRKKNEEYLLFLKSQHFKSKVIFIKYNHYNIFYKFLVIRKNILAPLTAEHKDSKRKLKMLDVGGSGRLTCGNFLKSRMDFTLCDSYRSNLREASRNGLKTVGYKGIKLPFKSNHFDAVLCRNTFEYMENGAREELCKELIRISRGYVFLMFSNNRHFQWLERRNRTLLKKAQIPLPYPRGMLPPIDISAIKPFFKGAKVIKYGNTFLWYLVSYLRANHPFFLYRLIKRFNTRMKYIHRIRPYQEIALVYHKSKEEIKSF